MQNFKPNNSYQNSTIHTKTQPKKEDASKKKKKKEDADDVAAKKGRTSSGRRDGGRLGGDEELQSGGCLIWMIMRLLLSTETLAIDRSQIEQFRQTPSAEEEEDNT